jgi:hypothetical protein
MGAKTQNGGPQLLVLYWRAGEIHMVKDNGCTWVKWLTRRGHPPKSHPTSETIWCFRTSFPRHDYSPPIQGSLKLLNISKRKAEAGSSSSLQQDTQSIPCINSTNLFSILPEKKKTQLCSHHSLPLTVSPSFCNLASKEWEGPTVLTLLVPVSQSVLLNID